MAMTHHVHRASSPIAYLHSATPKTPDERFWIGLEYLCGKTSGRGAPGAPGVLGDVIFVFSDLENLSGPKMGSHALLLLKLIIFNTYLLEDALVKMHFPIRQNFPALVLR